MINLLDSQTIDKIAAGEVVERPASVVKELVENSMDAGADAITVEIKNGGIQFIRVTDNGCGISRQDMEKAFLRHATSKIRCIEDLSLVASMGFRGEALASIASVSRVEVISKCPQDLLGTRYEIEGAVSGQMEDVGAPDGTTILVRNLFYNTPVRRKFLKSEKTEGSYVFELLEQLALSRPDISFQLIANGDTKFTTSGQGQLKEAIYRIYGRSFLPEIIPISYEADGIVIDGYLGTPSLVRSNRNLESYFINRRFIKSDIIAKGIEKGYQEYLMQHKFPFCVLHFSMDTRRIDVNVHPTKKEVRFENGEDFFNLIADAVGQTLRSREMISSLSLEESKENDKEASPKNPEPFEANRKSAEAELAAATNEPVSEALELQDLSVHDQESASGEIPDVPGQVKSSEGAMGSSQASSYQASGKNQYVSSQTKNWQDAAGDIQTGQCPNWDENLEADSFFEDLRIDGDLDTQAKVQQTMLTGEESSVVQQTLLAEKESSDAQRMKNRVLGLMQQPQTACLSQDQALQKKQDAAARPQQLSFFKEEDRVLSANARSKYEIIGQVFQTYWLLTYRDSLYFLDQHAAHEKVNYEHLMKQYREGNVPTQQCDPPVIVTLSPKELLVAQEHLEQLGRLGFIAESFGGNEIAIREIPMELYRSDPAELFQSILEELSTSSSTEVPETIASKIATMACKASVKGGMKMSRPEIEALLDEMLTLDNPYHCPHGRPTMFSMTRYELEKKFKRVVD